MIAGLLFRLARSDLFSVVVRFGFAHLSGLLPVRRVGETEQVIAFHHPRPGWQPHILFVPKAGIASLLASTGEKDAKIRQLKYEDVADMRFVAEAEKEGFFKKLVIR